MRHLNLIIACLVLPALVAADSPLPKRAEQAREKYDRAIEKAWAEYEKAEQAARKVYLRELEQVLKESTRDGNFDEASSVKAEMERVGAEYRKQRAITITIPAASPWTEVGYVRSGDRLTIEASGTWANRAGAVVTADGIGKLHNGLPAVSLVGRIGSGEPFFVGSRATIEVSESGTMFLGCNDSKFADNSGELSVTITPAN